MHGDSKHPEQATPPLRPPLGLQISRWFVFTATVAIAIGMIAMLDKHLTGLPFLYDGPQVQFRGLTVTIEYCLLSTSPNAVAQSNCSFAFAAAAVSLALSLIWTYIQSLRRNPYKHRNARIADLTLCLLATCWWIACGIVLCFWTHAANSNGLARADWRNGLCVLAWAEALFFAYLTITSALLATAKSQKLFDKWETKKKTKQQQKEAARLQKMQNKAAESDAEAEAARVRPHAAPAGPPLAHAAVGNATPAAVGPHRSAAPQSAWPAATGPTATIPAATGPAIAGPATTGPAIAGPAARGPAATEGITGRSADNPFVTEGSERTMQPSLENV